MSTPPAPRTWVSFIGREDFAALEDQGGAEAHITPYRIESSSVHRGDAVSDFKPGARILRIATQSPLALPDFGRVLSGVTQHLHYTSDAQRARLAAISAKELPAGENVHAVLIPIRKSDAWWNMGHHERAEFLNGMLNRRGHTAIGEEYAALIYRQLLHSRYLDSSRKAYDFLTYFEFTEANADWFRALLHKLRDPVLNPEWEYVEMEQEIWMRKGLD